MKFRNFVDVEEPTVEPGVETNQDVQDDSTDLPEKPLTFVDEVERDQYYYNIMNPETGERFDIPLLIKTNPSYYYKYINYMKIRERSPETFATIMNWG